MARLLASHACSATAMAMPWPALLAVAWRVDQSAALVAVVASARVAPYVLLSWYAGSLGDRWRRGRVLRASTVARVGLLAAAAAGLAAGQLAVAVAAATAAVAAGTPAYPTLAAALPDVDPRRSEPATRVLVTTEVAAFTAGPAVGGLVLAVAGPDAAVGAAALLAAAGALVLGRVPVADGARGGGGSRYRDALQEIRRRGAVVAAIAMVCVVNAILGALAVALLALSDTAWSGGDHGFGLATAAIGAGALAAPLCGPVLRVAATEQVAPVIALAAGLAVVAVAPGWQWSVLPLAVAGLAATQVECAVTTVLQRSLPSTARASALGITDTAMVAASLAGAAAAPFVVRATGPSVFVALLAVATLGSLALARPWPARRREGAPAGASAPAPRGHEAGGSGARSLAQGRGRPADVG